MLCGIFHFYSNFKTNFCIQKIRRRILRHLIRFCTVCRCPTNRTLCLQGLNKFNRKVNVKFFLSYDIKIILKTFYHENIKILSLCTSLRNFTKYGPRCHKPRLWGFQQGPAQLQRLARKLNFRL